MHGPVRILRAGTDSVCSDALHRREYNVGELEYDKAVKTHLKRTGVGRFKRPALGIKHDPAKHDLPIVAAIVDNIAQSQKFKKQLTNNNAVH